MREMASGMFLRASLRSRGTKCESRQDDRAGQVKRWSTDMEMLVQQKGQDSGKRSEIKWVWVSRVCPIRRRQRTISALRSSLPAIFYT